jgi:ankyrin repeat protein
MVAIASAEISIHQATICNVVGMVFQLLEKGQDINEPDLQSKTPLIHASYIQFDRIWSGG